MLEEAARAGDATARELGAAAGLAPGAVEPTLYGLQMMGYLAPEADRYRLGNWFFERWLRRAPAGHADAERPV